MITPIVHPVVGPAYLVELTRAQSYIGNDYYHAVIARSWVSYQPGYAYQLCSGDGTMIDPECHWSSTLGQNGSWSSFLDVVAREHPLLPPLPAVPPEEAQPPFHNPLNLTPEQIGVAEGWRLLTVSEVAEGQRQPADMEYYGCFGWVNTDNAGYVIASHRSIVMREGCYRTKQPLPGAAAPPSDPWASLVSARPAPAPRPPTPWDWKLTLATPLANLSAYAMSPRLRDAASQPHLIITGMICQYMHQGNLDPRFNTLLRALADSTQWRDLTTKIAEEFAALRGGEPDPNLAKAQELYALVA